MLENHLQNIVLAHNSIGHTQQSYEYLNSMKDGIKFRGRSYCLLLKSSSN